MLFPNPARASLLAALAMLLILLPQAAFGADPLPRTVLVIDGSGSMWGRIDGREKIVIARQLLADNLGLLKDKTELGVMSYGHRRRRDCRDIEMIVPIGPVEPAISGKTIKRLLPRGKTPISSALQQASAALYQQENELAKRAKNHIILVADGTENCRRDPCETASGLATRYPGLSIHVIGFAVRDADLPRLRCIADNGRGRFQNTLGAAQLEKAITRVFASLAPQKSQPAKPVRQVKKAPPGIYLTAGLSQTGPALQNNVAWRIYKHGESSRTGASPLKRQTGAGIYWQLPQGSYHIEARHHALFAEQDVELRPGKPLKRRLSFNVGVVTANARLNTGSPVSSDIIFSLYDASAGATGPANIIAHKQEKNAKFFLKPGKYSLRARAGETGTQQDFALKAGHRQKFSLLLNAGQVRLQARLASGYPFLSDVQYALFRRGDKSDTEFVRTLDPHPQLVLPAGKYLILARQGAASSYQKVTVTAGENKAVSLDLDAGVLKLTSSLDAGSKGHQAQIAWTIKPASTTPPKTVKLSLDNRLVEVDQSLPTRSFRNSFILPAGAYMVHALYGNSNAGAVTRVEVVAGKQSARNIVLSAGRVRLSLVLSAGDQPLPGVFWSILDKTGKQVASASSRAPVLTLATGSYQVVADYLGGSYRRDFTVKNGDNRKIQLKIN